MDSILLTMENFGTFNTIAFGVLCCTLMVVYYRFCFWYAEYMALLMAAIVLILIAGEYYDYFDIPWWSYVGWLVLIMIWNTAHERSPDEEKKCDWCNSRLCLKLIWGEVTQRYRM